MVMEPMQGKLASSQFDLGHTNQFCVPEVTSVFFSSGDCVVGTTTTLESSIKQIEALYVFDLFAAKLLLYILPYHLYS